MRTLFLSDQFPNPTNFTQQNLVSLNCFLYIYLDPEQELNVDVDGVAVSAGGADLDISLPQVGRDSAGRPVWALLTRSEQFDLQEDDISITGDKAGSGASIGRVFLTQLQVGLNLILNWITDLGPRLTKAVRDILQLAPSSVSSSEDGSLLGRTELLKPECWVGDFPHGF